MAIIGSWKAPEIPPSTACARTCDTWSLATIAMAGVFPPVMFDIELGGQHFQEMHGDGGTVNQAFLYPPNISARLASAAVMSRPRAAYVIRNGKALEDWKETERRTLAIAGRAVSTLIASNGVGDIYRLYTTTKRDGVAFNLAARLFDCGVELGLGLQQAGHLLVLSGVQALASGALGHCDDLTDFGRDAVAGFGELQQKFG